MKKGQKYGLTSKEMFSVLYRIKSSIHLSICHIRKSRIVFQEIWFVEKIVHPSHVTSSVCGHSYQRVCVSNNGYILVTCFRMTNMFLQWLVCISPIYPPCWLTNSAKRIFAQEGRFVCESELSNISDSTHHPQICEWWCRQTPSSVSFNHIHCDSSSDS